MLLIELQNYISIMNYSLINFQVVLVRVANLGKSVKGINFIIEGWQPFSRLATLGNVGKPEFVKFR